MKKVSIVIVTILLLTALTITAFATELAIKVTVKDDTLHRGDSITVTVSVPEKFSCKSGILLIGFDNSIFTRGDSAWLLENLAVSEPNGDAVFAMSSEREISGKIYQFQLKVADNAAYGKYPVNVTLSLRDGSGNTHTVNQTLTIAVECDHKYDSGEVTKEATCTAEGTKIRTCTLCGNKRTDKITKLGHKYDDGVVSKEPTCTEKGEKLFTCSRCEKTKTEEIDPAGHVYDSDCDTDCNTCGEIRTVEHNYDTHWTSDETGHWHGCADCGHVLELFPHTPGPEATETTEQLCLDCGFVLQTFKPHEHVSSGDWLGDENNHWNQCACGENIDSAAHDWVEGTKDSVTGAITYSCSVCGYVKTVMPEPTIPETDPAPTQPGNNSDGQVNTWMIVSLVLAILLLASWIYIILGIISSKKRSGKFSS